MFEFILMLVGFLLIYLIIRNFEKVNDRWYVFLMPTYTIFLFLEKIYDWHVPIYLTIIIFVIMSFASIFSFGLGISALIAAKTNEEKTVEVITRQKLAEWFGIVIIPLSLAIVIKIIYTTYIMIFF